MKIAEEVFQKALYPGRWYDNGHYFGISPWVIEKRLKDRGEIKKLTGKWCRIVSKKGAIYRVLRFQPHLSAGKSTYISEISLDYDGGRVLGFNSKGTNAKRITIRTLYLHEYLIAAVCNPDPSYRIASWLGIIALALGILSVIISVIPLIK